MNTFHILFLLISISLYCCSTTSTNDSNEGTNTSFRKTYKLKSPKAGRQSAFTGSIGPFHTPQSGPQSGATSEEGELVSCSRLLSTPTAGKKSKKSFKSGGRSRGIQSAFTGTSQFGTSAFTSQSASQSVGPSHTPQSGPQSGPQSEDGASGEPVVPIAVSSKPRHVDAAQNIMSPTPLDQSRESADETQQAVHRPIIMNAGMTKRKPKTSASAGGNSIPRQSEPEPNQPEQSQPEQIQSQSQEDNESLATAGRMAFELMIHGTLDSAAGEPDSDDKDLEVLRTPDPPQESGKIATVPVGEGGGSTKDDDYDDHAGTNSIRNEMARYQPAAQHGHPRIFNSMWDESFPVSSSME